MNIDRPILIGCAGRSGSTMYYRVLARHRDVGWLSTYNQKLPSLPWVAIASRLYRMGIFSSIRDTYAFPKPFSPYRFWEHHLPGTARHDRPLVADDIPDEAIEPLRRTIRRILKCQGKNRFLMKVTGWARLAYFDRVFPGIRFVHLRREPIAVVCSWLKAGWLGVTADIDSEEWEWGAVPDRYREIYRELGGGPLLSAAVKTQLDVDDIRRNISWFPGRCYEVDYEALVVDPHRYFRETLEFCELEWTEAFERNVNDAKIRDYSDRWKKQLTADEAALITSFFDRVTETNATPEPPAVAIAAGE